MLTKYRPRPSRHRVPHSPSWKPSCLTGSPKPSICPTFSWAKAATLSRVAAAPFKHPRLTQSFPACVPLALVPSSSWRATILRSTTVSICPNLSAMHRQRLTVAWKKQQKWISSSFVWSSRTRTTRWEVTRSNVQLSVTLVQDWRHSSLSARPARQVKSPSTTWWRLDRSAENIRHSGFTLMALMAAILSLYRRCAS